MMMHKAFYVAAFVASVGLGVALGSPSIAAPIDPIGGADSARLAIEPASFWGWPYPYGYAYGSYSPDDYDARPCTRYVRVRTHHGWRKKRVSVCH